MLAMVGHNLLVTSEVLPHAQAKTAQCLKKKMVLHTMRPRVMMMMSCVMLSKITSTRPSMNKTMMCDEKVFVV
jgi:hypothetical protein